MFVAFQADAFFSFVLMCACIFYFASRKCSEFKFVLNSNEFAIYKRFEN
jgi:hypothetical protein